MTGGEQFWVAVGIPSLLILIGMWRNDKRFDAMDARILSIEKSLIARIDEWK